MMAYPSFIYLQNQKTGCTFVETFLRKFCSEPLLAHAKHAALHRSPGKFCFTNVREPLALYRSLFTYGLDGKGSVFCDCGGSATEPCTTRELKGSLSGWILC